MLSLAVGSTKSTFFLFAFCMMAFHVSLFFFALLLGFFFFSSRSFFSIYFLLLPLRYMAKYLNPPSSITQKGTAEHPKKKQETV